ncbi:MAG TPA: hypothetical protein VFR48_02925, partial [Solirubrobacteraceae bacterium]|nr:hypothetical protein [Solirubrobacteraceae bacterium]
ASTSCDFKPDPYIPIPDPCQGQACATGLFPEYTFTSSNPDIGQFVEADPASPEGTTVLQGANGKPIPDEPRGITGALTASGRFEENTAGQRLNEHREVVSSPQPSLFCAYNAGTTTITVHAGGLSASVPVTILSGSVEQPCGTAPLHHPPAAVREAGLPVPLPAPAPSPSPVPNSTLPPPPPPPAPIPLVPPSAKAPITALPAVPVPQAQLFPLIALTPPPAPSAGRPTPPSGGAQVPSQSPVSQQVSVAEREEEQERAIQHVHHMSAYRPHEEGPAPAWALGLLLIALVAGVGLRRRGGEPAYATQRAR